MPKSPPTFPTSQTRVRPKIHSVAIYVVALFIFLQILSIGSVFWLRRAVVQIEVSAPPTQERVMAPEAPESSPPPQIKVERERRGPNGRLNVKKWTERERKIYALHEEAKAQEQKKNFAGARAALEKALALASEHPATLAQLGSIEEAAGNYQKALEHWNHLIQLGEKAQNFLEIARKRVPIMEAKVQQSLVAETEKKRLSSLPQKLFVEATTRTPNPIPQDPKEVVFDFILRSTLPSTSANKIRVQLFFYDILPSHELIPAKIEAHFTNANPNWNANKSEPLRARYVKSNKPDGRHYYGYLLRLIYEDQVQYEQAEPLDLLRYFPYKNGL